MLLARYEIDQELTRNTSFVLSRGRSGVDGKSVLLKTPCVSPVPAVEERLLAAEYALLQGLRLPGVAAVQAFLSDDNTCGLVYADPGGLPLPVLFPSRRLDLGTFLPLAIRLTASLAELHRHEIIHQHLTPWSVLLQPTTQEVCLIDCGLASRMVVEAHTAQPVLAFALRNQTLAYLSPEQTGRMNRHVDYRTDLYTLGILFYELLTGAVPFQSADVLELMHWHIARMPPAPVDLVPEMPLALSQIVLKLLAKTAEERYQSVAGLQKDLERCASAWAIQGQSVVFPLGQHDLSDRFLIPQKLYGRAREVKALLQAFDTICQGHRTMLLVDGYAGIGKTALIQELYRPIVRQRGYFIAGKCDQVVRSVPFSALIQALRGLVRQLLSESEERLAQWRTRLSAALGSNGGVLVEVIPEIALIIGSQPPPSGLGPTEALNRFQLVFQHFVGVLAQPEHPLVMFLDDLQWADPATLSLLQPLLTSQDIRCLFIIGAYRDNEVYTGHPLLRTLTALEADWGTLQRVTLGPLGLADVIALLCDTLHGEPGEVEPLARLVMEKTAGNPFFVGQFLKALRQEGYLTFDYDRSRWSYHLDQVSGADITDNVVDLMTRKLQRLAPSTQRLVTLAACMGNPFDRETLAIVSERSSAATADGLSEALGEGLILPAVRDYGSTGVQDSRTASTSVPAYVFLHDRVQQAAYACIPAEHQQSVHLTVGRLLQARAEQTQTTDEALFDLVHHLNRGSSLMTDEAERLALARLNVSAGQKAKAATAYEAARDYLVAGLHLLSEADWESEYELFFTLHFEAASCHYLCGHFDQAEQLLEVLLTRARTALDQARVYNLRGVQYENMSRYAAALASARQGLELLGITFADTDADKHTALEAEIATIQVFLGQRSIASLIDLPVMTDPATRMVMTMLTDIWSSAYILGEVLLARLLSATMVRLSLTHGNLEESAYGYVTHAITVGPVRGDYQAAYAFGLLALQVNERFQDTRRRAKIHQQFHAHVALWRQPLAVCMTHAREACRSGLESGDFLYAAYGAYTETWPAMMATQNLAHFVRDYTPGLELIRKLKNTSFGDAHHLALTWARALQGHTRAPLALADNDFDEQRYMETYRDNPFFSMFYYTTRMQLAYLLEAYEQALEARQQASRVVRHLSGTLWTVLFDFWGGLTLAACYENATAEAQRAYWQELRQAQAALAVLADNCAENFRCPALLLEAEIARLQGQPLAAMELYERALRYADEIQSVQYQALAHDLYARCCRQQGQERLAAALITAAHVWYSQWGAAAKVAVLERQYPALLAQPGRIPLRLLPEPLAQSVLLESPDSDLDFSTVMKATQAMTSEIDLEKLLAQLMRIAIENAGAERGSLILEREGDAFLYAEGSLDTAQVHLRHAMPLSQTHNLPTSIVHYVRRTLENVVLAEAGHDDRYALDPYIQRCAPRSILGLPVQTQGRLLGVLYLEHTRVSGAFSAARIQMMQMLAAQAAISLENALLYDAMKQEVVRRRQAEDDVRTALAEVEQLKNRLQAENVYLQEEILQEHNFEEMVGSSPALLHMLQQVESVASTDATVLVYGETGTGKELIARALHNRSARKERPLVKVNCGAIAAGLVESELFGHVKGAFTGALERRIGRFELADGGTIFLDEVGELPLDTQVKLLRVLQEQEFEPVGSSRTVRVDVRILAATNRNLAEAVRAGSFRADLFYRLNVFPIQVPSLRERRADIPQLVMFFLSRLVKKFGKKIETVPQATMDLLTAYDWPGNIRELQNLIERLVVLTQGSVLRLEAGLMPMATAASPVAVPAPSHSSGSAPPSSSPALTEALTLEEIEKRHILAVLRQAAWVIEGPHGAARILNVHPNTLRSRMKKMGLSRASHALS